MKILKKVLILVLVCLLPLSVATACAPKTCTITFVQDGQESIVRTVEKGSALTDIPQPEAVVGYDVVWNVTDFSNIQEDMTVTAVATAKTFTITFVVSENAENHDVVLLQTTQTVTYNQPYALTYPTYIDNGEQFILSAWLKDGVEFASGVWTLLEDITLTMDYFEPVNSQGEWIS